MVCKKEQKYELKEKLIKINSVCKICLKYKNYKWNLFCKILWLKYWTKTKI